MSTSPVRIIGAGISGLTIARCLRNHGVPAILYERKPANARPGHGITLHASSYGPLLTLLDLDEADFKRRVAVDSATGGSGRISPQSLANPSRLNEACFRAHRGRLEEFLSEGLDIRWDVSLEHLEASQSGTTSTATTTTTLHFSNGQRVESECVIAADGPHSSVRTAFCAETALPKILPYAVYRGRRQVTKEEFDHKYAPAMGDSTVFEKRPHSNNGTLISLWVDDCVDDYVRLSWVYSRPASSDGTTTDALFRPERQLTDAKKIPNELYSEISSSLTHLQPPFADIFDSDEVQNDRALHWLMRSVLVNHEELINTAKRGIFLVGDAAHAEPILGGNGANTAITDGVWLAKCISEQGIGGVSRWYESVYPRWEAGVLQSEQAIEKMHKSGNSPR